MVEQAQGLLATLKAGWERTWKLAADLWHELARAVPPLGRAGAFVFEVIGKYHKDDCLSYAAGLSFWLIVSLVPLSTLLFKLLGTILGPRAYNPATLKMLQEIVPYLPSDFIRDAVINSQKIGGMGLSWGVLLFGSYWGISQLDTSLAHVFGLRIKKHRQTRKNHLLRQVIFLVGGLLASVGFLAVLLGGALRKVLPAKQTDHLPYLVPLVGLVVMTLVLQHLPRLHVKFRHAFLGAGIATALWWLAKWGFGVYLNHTLTWGIMYGSLLGIVAGLTFLYYTCAIFLLGAEITAAFYRHETGAATVPPWLRVKAGEPKKPG
ncbi:MAG: YihY/virulence factor BrkB family protein [Holophagaceae bacterium]|uniref:YihY/virulence factor BrkB family protein n=1 Tax=Candidatus Geothrix skivensis TaxID=2954439 RepID=A0A9D7SCP5_9BACT|nr:YihY/virulence factor BrkB family protein [Candidatus Geothrix skivensis]